MRSEHEIRDLLQSLREEPEVTSDEIRAEVLEWVLSDTQWNDARKDPLPSMDEKVIIYSNYYGCKEGRYRYYDPVTKCHNWRIFTENGRRTIFDVIAWMPLPASPEFK